MSSSGLAAASEPLSRDYDLAMLDLDGVVYIGGEAITGAAGHLEVARADGMRIAYITNNAARPAHDVAAHLTELGVPAATEDVITSAQAAAAVLRARFGEGARVACCGGAGLEWSLKDAGLQVVGPEDADAIATGYGPDLPWRAIMRAAVAIAEGLPWIASNTDATIPTSQGVAPGHGALVDLIRRFSGVEPEVAGKPARPLLEETIRRVGASRPLMVGDRLDTDIEGARNVGVDALLVLTGVTGLAELVTARPGERPTYLARDLGGLSTPHPEVVVDGAERRIGGLSALVREGRLEVRGEGDGDDWWRVAAAAAWAYADDAGRPADVSAVVVPDVAAVAR